MVFKPSFKCLKNRKINLSPVILKLETLLFILYYIRRAILIQKKRSGLIEKNMPYMIRIKKKTMKDIGGLLKIATLIIAN